MDLLSDAKDIALRFLSYRPRSEMEVRRYLAGKGHTESIQDEVVVWLRHLNYVDDLRFARQWIESRNRSNPMGSRRLFQELRQKGVSEAVIHQAFEDYHGEADEAALAKELALKQAGRYKGQEGDAVTRKLSGYLARRGFKSAHIHQAVQEALRTLPLP